MNETEQWESELVRRVREGDKEAFRAIVAEHGERLYGLALRIMGEDADAMDLTQEVFVQAWSGIGNFRGESRLLTWLQGIALRTARRTWRGGRRRTEREARYARERYLQTVRQAMPEATIDLERAIADLPIRMRTAFVLHCMEGLAQREVARLMGVSEGTVKAHVHGARKALKERLET